MINRMRSEEQQEEQGILALDHNITNNDEPWDSRKETSTVEEDFNWTFLNIVWSIGVFFMAGVAEITGGWMVWASIRGHKHQEQQQQEVKRPWWFALIGSLVLILYGFIPCAQPTDSFGRIYAVYGGFFIVMSFLFGWTMDGNRPDTGDIVGGMIAMVGVLVVMFWPRGAMA
jgi:Uncharacterized conserved protein